MIIKRVYGGLTILVTVIFIFSTPVFGKVAVFVSIAPQQYFVQQICKELADVQVMVPPGANPATYEPKPRQMAAISKTRIYFSIGVPFENTWLKKIAAINPDMAVIPTDRGIKKLPMAAHHRQEDENQPEHGSLDPHIWLSPPLVMIQARTILEALQEADAAHRFVYENNYRAFILQLSNLDAELRNAFSGRSGQQVMVFHPSWGYFAQAYGLKQVSIEVEGKEPKPAQLRELIEHARENGIKFVFVQPQFSARSAKLIAGEIGGQVVFADPLAEDWAGNLRAVARKFESALR
ncbi:metal ABC transporter solute-binding protein, Zn/Mn family [Thermodesulfobacteriota bacterium]